MSVGPLELSRDSAGCFGSVTGSEGSLAACCDKLCFRIYRVHAGAGR